MPVLGAAHVLTLQEVANTVEGAFVKKNSLSAVVSEVLKWRNGARGIVFKGPQVGIGHYFNMVNDQGKVVFFGFQRGK
ncbi:toxin glutamine deamidase domain-containing protein [Streptomyces sp. CdTB01]|uniref:toxin glutamine deamidase domain-containing protein n=1 Tax=Streptomyces sp. CdTB01 TaxID=1725411 RepID=UPI000D19ADA9|nr:toxin glutamine deamidase domain-containing protein [Streptomyces sp. CdTB01]